MTRISKDSDIRESDRNKCTFVQFLVIVLSFISLLSRIIYCTYATWLTITTYDCIPCNNITATNASSDLFISHHSSAVFKTIRGLNIRSEIESERKVRAKRSEDLEDMSDSEQFGDNYPQFFSSNDYNHIKQKAQNLTNEAFSRLNIDLNSDQNWTESQSNGTKDQNKSIREIIYKLFSNHSKSNDFYENSIQSESQTMVPSFFGEELQNQSQFEDQIQRNSNTFVVPIAAEVPSDETNRSDKTSFEMFTYIPNEIVVEFINNTTNETNDSDGSKNLSNSSLESNNIRTNSSKEDHSIDDITMTILLNDQEFNTSTNESIENFNHSFKSDPKLQERSLNNYQLINDTYYLSSGNLMNVCSEDCAQFLNIDLSDPFMRKWATIVITGVLYLYAFTMFSIFIGSCLALVDLLVISTFIEGAKLFAGFILIIIDSFNGKEVHFNLIDIKFHVNSRGNGWTADFSYSEYLLDIIIFFLSTYLCLRVFKCFEKRPKKVSSVEELADTRGTYRSNHSRSSLEPIYEHN